VKEHRDPQVLAEQISEKKIRTVGRPKKGEDNKFDIINIKATNGGTSFLSLARPRRKRKNSEPTATKECGAAL
jgi:hypothetical protein